MRYPILSLARGAVSKSSLRNFLLFCLLSIHSGCALMGSGIDTVEMGNIGVPEDLADEYAISESPEAGEMPTDAPANSKIAEEKEKDSKSKPSKAKLATSATGKKSAHVESSQGNKNGKTAKRPKIAAIPISKKERQKLIRAAGPEGKTEFYSRRKGKGPFYPGEYHKFSLTYFGVEAGTLDLWVMPYKYIKGRKVYHIQGHGKSTSVFSLFYRVNDTGDSFMDYEGLFSHKFHMRLDETLQQHELIELYDQENRKVHYWQQRIHKRKGFKLHQFTGDIYEFTQDAITAAFFLRTFDLEVGKEYSYPVVSNGKSWTVKAMVVRKEELITDAGTFQAFVVKPETQFEGVLQKSGDVFFWISADEHKSFLKIDAKVKIGSVIAYLKELRHGTPDE